MMVKQVKPLLEQYHVTAFIAGHDHCMESFVQNGVDYHGMGASHENDPSTAHKNSVPPGSLQFHAEGKSGGFGSFTVNATSFVARHHEGDGTLRPLVPPAPSPPRPRLRPPPQGHRRTLHQPPRRHPCRRACSGAVWTATTSTVPSSG
jgi:hypothetical protein